MSVQSNGVSHWLGAKLESALYCVHGSNVVSICVKSQNQGQCYLLDCDWFQQACLSTGPWLTWFQQACFVFNTGELIQTGRNFWKVCTLPPQLLDICTPWPCNGPYKWVNHYKVVFSSWRQLSSFSLWEGVRFWGNFFSLGKFLSCLWWVEIHVDCSFHISISLYFGFFCYFLYNNLLLIIGSKSIGLFCFFVFWVDTLMMTWLFLFLVALPSWILSVTNLKLISIFAGCIEYLSFLSWNKFCYSSLLCKFRINRFLQLFVAIFTVF